MNLKEMEDAARKRQEEEVAAGVQKAKAEKLAEAEGRNELELRAAAYITEMTGGLLEELEDAIFVPSRDYWDCLVEISLPEHATIQTRLRWDEDKVIRWSTGGHSKWHIFNSCGSSKHCQDLGDALAIAACLWAEAEEAEEKAAQVEAGREAVRKQRKLDRIERGLHYVGIFEDHPFLKPIFNLLVTYVEDKEIFEADLDAVEEFAASMDESYMRKLNESRMAQAEADNARHRLQQDLWAEQEARRNLERQRKW